MYRPEGWDTDKLVEAFDETKPATEFDYFEAGADAYEEGLKKEHVLYCMGGNWEFAVKGGKSKAFGIKGAGYLVFIPEEE